ncbi:Uncharacterized protein DAT39_011681 [Clarias magur]|uniref:Uncharacterized protein n=1 Tax=Clarias magur TaxID=1594786 RepID=A0A8J4XDI1_CLAMG|nr:Uncharacterized protein DAT39_011681 [Clarias magur]
MQGVIVPHWAFSERLSAEHASICSRRPGPSITAASYSISTNPMARLRLRDDAAEETMGVSDDVEAGQTVTDYADQTTRRDTNEGPMRTQDSHSAEHTVTVQRQHTGTSED